MIKQVITSDLAGENSESAESDVGRPHLMARSRFEKRPFHTHSIESHSRAGAQILSLLDSQAVSNFHPRRSLASLLTGRSAH